MAFDILLAEDNRAISDGLKLFLESEGYSVRVAEDGEKALVAYREKQPDLLILDVMMPIRTGFEVCREIRQHDAALPILMLTALGDEQNKVIGLGFGADDYLTKPFSLHELTARVKALLRRANLLHTSTQPGVTAKDLPSRVRIGSHVFDRVMRSLVSSSGETKSLTPNEANLLCMLLCARGVPVARTKIVSALYGNTVGHERSIDQYVLRIRHKLGEDGSFLATLPWEGYVLKEN